MQLDDQLRARMACLDSGTRPEPHLPNAVAQTRIVSVARIRLDSWKSVRPFKVIFCDDISEFESYMPSHAVGSLWRVYPVHGLKEDRSSCLTLDWVPHLMAEVLAGVLHFLRRAVASITLSSSWVAVYSVW